MKYALVIVPAAVLGLALGFLVASCGADEATPAGPLPSVADTATEPGTETLPPPAETDTAASETETPTETEPRASVTYQVWFAQGDSLFVAYRTQPQTQRIGTAAMEALLAGPASLERANGVASAVPDGTQLLGLGIEDGIAHLDLTSEFESGGGSLSMQLRLAQVVYTLTQFPTVKGVVFSLDGEPVEVLGGEGIVIDHPLTRKEFADLLPPILVTSPLYGQTVANPVLVKGSANVFEANVTVRILDANGAEITRTFTTATCGTGCRGTFSVPVPYEIDEAQDGTIVVHDDDASGGAEGFGPHEVRIPVHLTPSA